jgi:hypothetical protein
MTKITIALPDDIAERVRCLPDRDEFVTRAVEAALAGASQSAAREARASRWTQLVERIERQGSSLGDYAKELDADRRELRQNLRFPHDER